MSKSKLFIFGILFVLLCAGIVSAVKPIQTNLNLDEGLGIRFPQLETLKTNTDYELNFHVFNISNGLPSFNYTSGGKLKTECWFHLYNNSGGHILNISLNSMDETFDFDYTIDKSNFSKAGLYPYIIQCNSTFIGGFASGIFEVTDSGRDETTTNNGPLLVLIGSAAMLLFASFMIKDRLLELLFRTIGLLLTVFSINSAIYMGNFNVHLNGLLEISLVVLIYGILLFFVVYQVIVFIGEILERKRKKRMGEEDEGD